MEPITDNQNMKVEVALWHVDGWSAAYAILRRADVLEIMVEGAWFYLRPIRIWVHGDSFRFTIEGSVTRAPRDRSRVVRVMWERSLSEGALPIEQRKKGLELLAAALLLAGFIGALAFLLLN